MARKKKRQKKSPQKEEVFGLSPETIHFLRDATYAFLLSG